MTPNCLIGFETEATNLHYETDSIEIAFQDPLTDELKQSEVIILKM